MIGQCNVIRELSEACVWPGRGAGGRGGRYVRGNLSGPDLSLANFWWPDLGADRSERGFSFQHFSRSTVARAGDKKASIFYLPKEVLFGEGA